jgi:Spy/CpxP family protein refolding chaperone
MGAVTSVLVLVSVGAASAQGMMMRRHLMGPGFGGGMGGPGGPPAFLSNVFSPRQVMAHQLELGLRPEQIDAIKAAMLETHQKLLDLQWKLDADTEKLSQLLAADHVDEAKVLAKLDEVTEVERNVKKTNFTLLVRVKNLLDPEQQAKMRKLRPFEMRRGGGARAGPPPRGGTRGAPPAW